MACNGFLSSVSGGESKTVKAEECVNSVTAAARSRSTERLSRGSRAGDGCSPCEGTQPTVTPLQSQLDNSCAPCRKPPLADRQERFCPFRGFESTGESLLLAFPRPACRPHVTRKSFTSQQYEFLDGERCKHDARLLPSELGTRAAVPALREGQPRRMHDTLLTCGLGAYSHHVGVSEHRRPCDL